MTLTKEQAEAFDYLIERLSTNDLLKPAACLLFEIQVELEKDDHVK